MVGVQEVSVLESDGKVIVVRWRGSRGALETDLTAVGADGRTRVVVDLEGAEAVDSRTLTILHRMARRMRSGGWSAHGCRVRSAAVEHPPSHDARPLVRRRPVARRAGARAAAHV